MATTKKIVYLMDVTKNCEDSLPMTPSGNGLDPASLVLTCQCGATAHINWAQELGLDPASPDFESRAENILAEFTSLSYYVVTVEEGVMKAECRFRKSVTVNFHTVMECKTCNTSVSGSTCSQRQMDEFVAKHKGHEVLSSTVLDTDDPRVASLVDQALKRQPR